MEDYLKRFVVGHLLLLVIVACTIYYFGISKVISVLLFFGLIEFLFYYLDAKYLPKRKAELASKLNEIFKAEPVAEGVMKFNLDTFDLFAKIEVDYKLGLQFANVETISFHIPIYQFERLPTKPGFELMEDKVDEVQTFIVYQTDSKGLEDAKKNLENML